MTTETRPAHSPLGASGAEHICSYTDHPRLSLYACTCGQVGHGGLILKPRPDKDGYLIADYGPRSSRKTIKIHRVVLACFEGEQPAEVDHIDRDRTNLNRSNLRYLSSAANRRNIGVRRHSTSGIRNVRFRKDKNKWQAYSCTAGKFKHRAYVNSADEAAQIAQRYYNEH